MASSMSAPMTISSMPSMLLLASRSGQLPPAIASTLRLRSVTASSTPAQVMGSSMQLYGLDATSGKILWTAAPTGDALNSSPAVAKGIVYIGSPDGQLYAYNATTGKLIWSTHTYNQVNSSPTVANGVVYVGSWDGELYACDATTGKILWTGGTQDHIFASPAVVNGVVYISSWDKHLYAFHLRGAKP